MVQLKAAYQQHGRSLTGMMTKNGVFEYAKKKGILGEFKHLEFLSAEGSV